VDLSRKWRLKRCVQAHPADPLWCSVKAKFHYAIVGSELVRSWFDPDSVMKFGFKPFMTILSQFVRRAIYMPIHRCLVHNRVKHLMSATYNH